MTKERSFLSYVAFCLIIFTPLVVFALIYKQNNLAYGLIAGFLIITLLILIFANYNNKQAYMIKFLIILALLFVFAINYKIISLEGGIKYINVHTGNSTDIEKFQTAFEINKTYYYANPFSNESYLIILDTIKDGMIFINGDISLLNLFRASGIILTNINPQPITLIPWWIFASLILFIIVFPIRKQQKKDLNSN